MTPLRMNRQSRHTRIVLHPSSLRSSSAPCPPSLAGRTGLPQLRMLLERGRGNLGDQLAQTRMPERLEAVGPQQEGSGPADHIVAIVVVEAAGWIGMVGVPRHRLLAQNHEAVDGHALGHRLIARK